jgi:outer membrane protein OmpA-like peptidoglycan-associated protein
MPRLFQRFLISFPLLFVLFLAPFSARALDLRLDQDAWSLGMGGATAAIGGGTHAFFINPAGTDRATVPMIQLGGVWRSGDLAQGGHLIMLFPTGDGTVFGLGVLQDGAQDRYRNRLLEGTAAIPLEGSHRLQGGIGFKILSGRLDDDNGTRSAHGLSVDLGLIYDCPLRNGDVLSFGCTAKDATSGLHFSNGVEDSVTRSFTFAAAYQDSPWMRLEADYEIVDRGRYGTQLKNRMRLGAERFLAHRRYSIRAGFDDVFDSTGSLTAGGGYHPDRPFELQAALGLSEKDHRLTASFSGVYRLDGWNGREHVGEKASGIDLGGGEEAPSLTPAEGRPVSKPPLRHLEFSVSPQVISPNGDGRDDQAVFKVSGASEEETSRWEIEIRPDGSPLFVRSFNGTGPVPASLVWDGSDAKGRRVRDGRYEIDLRTFDREAILATEDFLPLDVQSGLSRLNLTASSEILGPGGKVTFRGTIPPGAQIVRWEFEITDAFTQHSVYATRGTSRALRKLSWNGLDEAGQSAPDSDYLCLLVAQDKAGNELKSAPLTVTLDGTPPEAALKVSHPQADFSVAPVTLSMTASDTNGVASWEIRIQDEAGNPFRMESGSGSPPRVWVWDGSGDRGGETAQPGAYFNLSLTATDGAGNRGSSQTVAVQVKGAAKPTEGKQMSLSLTTVYFIVGGADLDEDALKSLRGVIESIRPYLDKSTLTVKGYTSPDETGDPVKISHDRAAAVRDFLARSLSIDPQSIQAVGLGNADPPASSSGAVSLERRRRAVVSLTTTP